MSTCLHSSCSRSGEPTVALPGGLLQLPWRRSTQSICSRSGEPTVALPAGLLERHRRRCAHPSCSRFVAPIAGLPGGLHELPRRRYTHSRGSHSGAAIAGLPGGLLSLPGRRCPHPNCSHSVAPTAGLQDGPLWLRMSTCPDPKSSHSGGAIAALPAGLQQLLQHTTSLPCLVPDGQGPCTFPLRMGMPGANSLLPGRLQHLQESLCSGVEVPAGKVSVKTHLQALRLSINDLTCRKCPRDHPCTGSMALRIGSMYLTSRTDLFIISFSSGTLPRQERPRECNLSGRTRSRPVMQQILSSTRLNTPASKTAQFKCGHSKSSCRMMHCRAHNASC